MVSKRLSYAAIVLMLAGLAALALGHRSTLLFIPIELGLFIAALGVNKNAASNLAFAVMMLNALLLSVIYALLGPGILSGLAVFIAVCSFIIKMRLLSFSYTSFVFLEPIVAVLATGLYVADNLNGRHSLEQWLYPGAAVVFFLVLVIANLYDRLVLAKLSKNYTSVGSPAPVFTLQDENGKEVSLSDFRGSIVLLVFVRGDWCPGCHIMLRTYEKHRETLQQKGVTLLSIGPDPIGVNREMAMKIGLNFHILSDPDQLVAMKYTVELQQPTPNVPKSYKGVPLPASFLVDKQGIVRHTSRVENPGEILHPDKIIHTLAEIA